MIPRYTRPKMAAIWSEENRFRIMLDVEIAACEAMVRLKQVPAAALERIRERARINIPRIQEIEATVKHDVIAFLTQVGETVGPEARFLHLGMTSSDVLDTALAVQMKESCDLLISDITQLLRTIRDLAERYEFTAQMGRTHGVHAEPITFGLKAASWYSDMARAADLIAGTRDYVRHGKISGAVGTFAHISPRVEEYVCAKLGLVPEPVSTQIIPRDRHAVYLCRFAIVASMLERIAVEIRHLQRTEVQEVEEPFTAGQKGSSAMPHKRNPIISENICGLARLIRGFTQTALENVALWHERDISHSSAERVILPDASMALDFMLGRMNHLLAGLVVYPDAMAANMKRSQDVIFSGSLLLALVDKGLSREKAYALVQAVAFASRSKGIAMIDAVRDDREIARSVPRRELQRLFDAGTHFTHVPFIFKRVFDHPAAVKDARRGRRPAGNTTKRRGLRPALRS